MGHGDYGIVATDKVVIRRRSFAVSPRVNGALALARRDGVRQRGRQRGAAWESEERWDTIVDAKTTGLWR
jgi:hypothetical protein